MLNDHCHRVSTHLQSINIIIIIKSGSLIPLETSEPVHRPEMELLYFTFTSWTTFSWARIIQYTTFHPVSLRPIIILPTYLGVCFQSGCVAYANNIWNSFTLWSFFIYPTNTQLDCSKRMLKFTLIFTLKVLLHVSV